MEEEKKDKLSFVKFIQTLKWLIVYNTKLSPFVFISKAIVTVFRNLSPLFNAYIFARLLDIIINTVVEKQNINGVIPMLGVLLGFNLFMSAISYFDGYLQTAINYISSFKSTQVLYKHINSLGIQTLENPEVVNKIERAREIIRSLYIDFERFVIFLARIITLVVTAIIVVKYIPIVVGIIFLSMIPGFFSNRYYMKKNWKLYRDKTEENRRSNWVFNSLVEPSAMQEITITSAFKYLSNFYKKFTNRYVDLVLNISKKWQSFGFLFDSIISFSSIFGYFAILKNLFVGLISVGDVTFQMRSLDTFITSFSFVTNGFNSLIDRAIRINEVKEVFDMEPMVSDGDFKMPTLQAPPNIKFESISFKYPNSEKYVLQDLDLEIKPGEKIAIVGENGAGKTTLVKILSRFYKVDKGGVFLNDKDIDEIKIDSWYKNLGVLFQDYNTYGSLTLKENIYLGNSDEEINEDKIKASAKSANVNSFLSNFKNGYDQILSEKFKGGTRPSTGQWQKIAIARFFYRNSPVVIFDEPTASIDAISESEIFGQIYDFFKKKTVIIISHRFSTVRNADKIYVLSEGRIAEGGSHEELMKQKGKYHKAFTVQAKGYK